MGNCSSTPPPTTSIATTNCTSPTTEIKLEPFEWTIDNFAQKTGMLKSTAFNGYKEGCEWHMELQPNGSGAESIGKIALYLSQDKFAGRAVPISFKFSLPTSIKDHNAFTRVGQKNFTNEKQTWGFPSFMERSTVLDQSKGFLVEGKLKIICELTLFVERPLPEVLLAKQEKLFDSKDFADAVFVCNDDKEVRAWKYLLACHSPVFRIMLNNADNEEARTGRVKVDDFNSTIMEELTRFTCCGKVTQLDELVEELLVVADKYGIDDLKDLCARNMCETLTAENVCDRLIIADLYKIVSVKNAAFKFIKDNGRDMMQISGVKDIFATNSALAIELCSALTTF